MITDIEKHIETGAAGFGLHVDLYSRLSSGNAEAESCVSLAQVRYLCLGGRWFVEGLVFVRVYFYYVRFQTCQVVLITSSSQNEVVHELLVSYRPVVSESEPGRKIAQHR